MPVVVKIVWVQVPSPASFLFHKKDVSYAHLAQGRMSLKRLRSSAQSEINSLCIFYFKKRCNICASRAEEDVAEVLPKSGFFYTINNLINRRNNAILKNMLNFVF